MGYLRLNNIGKAYKRYHRKYGRFAEWLGFGIHHELQWVLEGFTFDVEPGEFVGIVGINGAGKSTLLKIITGTTSPTRGSVEVDGRISALLELGMGFHPEFTGRENACMNALLSGYDKSAIEAGMDEIEKFAEVGDYFDQPMRTYSTGMHVRVAFSVATAFRPDILIVDEALSVGDASFQRKCFKRIEKFRAQGTTLLLVSHDLETIKKMCDRALFIREGTLARLGPAKTVCDEYEKYLFGGRSQSVSSPQRENSAARFDPALVTHCEQVYGEGQAVIERCRIEDRSGRPINVVESGEPFVWRYRVCFHIDVPEPIFAMMIKTREGVSIYGTDTTRLENFSGGFMAGDRIEVAFELNNTLAPGIYYLNCGVRMDTEQGVVFLSRRMDAAILRVSFSSTTTVITGLTDMAASLSICDMRNV
jgi:lipopolysaccharide transport system ATP-binding protein